MTRTNNYPDRTTSFSALPVVLDDAATILGVVPYRDVMRLEHNYA